MFVSDFISYKMNINFYMFGLPVIHGLAAMAATPLLSHQIIDVLVAGTFSSVSKEDTQVNSAAVDARALYSDSVLDRATMVCFFQLYEIRFPL